MTTQGVRHSGWVTFAGVAALIAGAYNAITGLSTITTDYAAIEQAKDVLFNVHVNAWGWAWLIVGICQLFTGYLVLVRNTWGQFFGVALAGLSAMVALFTIFAWPLWAFSVLLLDLLVMYGLLTHSVEFD